MHFYPDLEPRVHLSYERDSWKETEGSLRITFDDSIQFRTESLRLDSDPWGTPLLKPDQVLMELKAPGAIPLWMVDLLTDMGLYKTSFSKYGAAYSIMTPLLKPDQVLMELKAPGAIPLWMVDLLTDMGLYKTSFSKYGAAYSIMLEQKFKGEKQYA